jgi:transposase
MMARYRPYVPEQDRFLPVSLSRQIHPGTFEYTLHYLIDNSVDLKVFEGRYNNDEVGARAIDPSILLKVVLLAYSRGILSSRRIAACCEENVLFMALSADTRPHFTTIAAFVSSMQEQIISVFRDILTVCWTEGLIGKQMFAVDGCKISSNCAKEWSGTTAQLRKKAQKLEESVRALIGRHREEDARGEVPEHREQEKRKIEKLESKAKKIQGWLANHDERMGRQGKPVKSNITDNESAKMPSGHGVIQGYNGIAVVDSLHQVVVDAQVIGEANEASSLQKAIAGVRETFTVMGEKRDIFEQVVLTADTGFHSEQSVREVLEGGVDAYVADNGFRRRDPRFAGAQEYKKKSIDSAHTSRARKYFRPEDFRLDEATDMLVCPAGKLLHCHCPNFQSGPGGYRGRSYMARAEDCALCELRGRCIRNPKTKARQVAKLEKGLRHGKKSFTQRMIERFDTLRGRYFYSRRMGTVEPVFANIRATLGMDRFTLRGNEKVDIQWKLFCIVNNIGKIRRFGRV